MGVIPVKWQYTINHTRIMATMALAIPPAPTVHTVFSKRVIEGMAAGAVKG